MHLLECRIIIMPSLTMRETSRGETKVVKGFGRTVLFNVHDPERLVSFLFADGRTNLQEVE